MRAAHIAAFEAAVGQIAGREVRLDEPAFVEVECEEPAPTEFRACPVGGTERRILQVAVLEEERRRRAQFGEIDAEKAAPHERDAARGQVCGTDAREIASAEQAVVEARAAQVRVLQLDVRDRKSTRLNSSHLGISYAVFCLKK